MSAKARAFPTKGKSQRVWFVMRDTSNVPITGAWTGAMCSIMTDGANVQNPAVNQIVGSHWGYIDIPDASMVGDTVQVTVSITNANARPIDVLIATHDLTPQAALPQDLDQLFALVYSRFFRTHTSDGTNMTVYADDDVTPLTRQAISISPYKVEKAF